MAMKDHSRTGAPVIILFCCVLAVLAGLGVYILCLRFLPEPDSSAVTMDVATPAPLRTSATQAAATPAGESLLVPASDPAPESERQLSPAGASFWLDGVLSTESSYRSPSLSVSVRAVADTRNFQDRVTYYVGDVFVDNVTQIRTESFNGNFSRTGHGEVADMARRTDSLLAISGDYYGHHNDSLVIRNGTVHRASLHQSGDVCLLLRDGTMETIRRKNADLNAILERDPWQAWQFGPSLFNADGSVRTSFSDSKLRRQNPRTAIGYVEPGHYIFVVVDGRQSHSYGVTLAELSRLMHSLGCKVAFNLDGGASAHFYWNDRIFNHPSKGGRQISDIVYVAKTPFSASPLFHGKEHNHE